MYRSPCFRVFAAVLAALFCVLWVGAVYASNPSESKPTVCSVVPESGQPGIEVVVRVDGFGEQVAVYFGKCEAEVLERPSRNEIVVRVPEPCQPWAFDDEDFSICNDLNSTWGCYGHHVPVTVIDLDTGEKATLGKGFVYINEQETAVLDVVPDAGPAGMLTMLTVRGVGEAVAVYFADVRADIVERSTLNEIVVAVPELEVDPTLMNYDVAKGSPLACNDDGPGDYDGPIYRIPVQVTVVDLDTGVRATWRRKFIYEIERKRPPLLVTGVKPSKGYPGMLATVLVKGFGEAVAVYFGGNEASVVERSSIGEIVVEVPPRDSTVPTVDGETYNENGSLCDGWWQHDWWGVPVPVTVVDLESDADATKYRAFRYVVEPSVAMLAVRNTEIEPNSTEVMVPILLDYHGTSKEGISTLVFAIEFDASVVTVQDVVPGESAQTAGKNVQSYMDGDGLVHVAVSGGTSILEQGVVCLLDISLDIKARRGIGTKLRFREVSASSPDGYELRLDTRPGVIRVGRSYDCNADGVVDSIDIQQVINFAIKAVTGLEDSAFEIADGDLDGDVDAVDIQRVINKTLGL